MENKKWQVKKYIQQANTYFKSLLEALDPCRFHVFPVTSELFSTLF